MTVENRPASKTNVNGTQARIVEATDLGYQPKDVGPLNVSMLKPPKGGTAVEPPHQPVAKESK